MPQSAFRQFLFHLKWSLWVLVVTAAAIGGTWWLLGRQGWFGVTVPPWMNLNVVLLMLTVAIFIPLTMLLRSNETRDLLQKCFLFSILVHVAATMAFSFIFVSRDVIQYVRTEMSDMEVPINLETARAAELQLAVRNQITNLPVATPKGGGDSPPQSAIEVKVEPLRPIQQEVPKQVGRPAALVSAPEVRATPKPGPVEVVAMAIPSADRPIPQLEIPLPQLRQAEAAAPPPPQANSSRMQLAWTAPAPQPLITGNLPVAQPQQSLMSEIPIAREGNPKAEILDIRPRLNVAMDDLPHIEIATPPVAPATGAEVPTVTPPTAQAARVESTPSRPSSISIGTGDSSNQIGSAATLGQPALTRLPPSFSESPSPDPFGTPAIEQVTLPDIATMANSADSAIAASDLFEPPRPSIGASAAGGGGVGRPGTIKASDLPQTAIDWAPEPVRIEPVKPVLPDIPEPITPKIATNLPEEMGPKPIAADALLQRSDEIRKPLVEQLGGSKATEDAVARALDYLSRNQESDGRWTRFTSDRTPRRRGQGPRDMALTGLATLAFLASDHTPNKDGPYRDHVAKALHFLMSEQRGDGNLRGNGGDMYDQAIATIALSEAAVMTTDPRYQRAAIKGAEYLVWAHNDRSGGWRYRPNESADTSVTGWSIMALHSAKAAGFRMPSSVRSDALRWLNSVSSGQHRILAGYQDARKPTETMTAQATFTRMLLGQQLTSEQIDEASRFVTRFAPHEMYKDFYHWYYVSLMLMQTQNEAWKAWNAQLSEHLLGLQRHDGHANGSWDPDGLRDDPGGRVYSTAIATLTLEVYYRYLPMYAGKR